MGFGDLFSRQVVLKFGVEAVEVIRPNHKARLNFTIEVDSKNIVVAVGNGGVTKSGTRLVNVFEASLKDLKVLFLSSFLKHTVSLKGGFVRPKAVALFSDTFIEKYGEVMVEFTALVLESAVGAEVFVLNERKEGILAVVPQSGRTISFNFEKPDQIQTQRVLEAYKDLL